MWCSLPWPFSRRLPTLHALFHHWASVPPDDNISTVFSSKGTLTASIASCSRRRGCGSTTSPVGLGGVIARCWNSKNCSIKCSKTLFFLRQIYALGRLFHSLVAQLTTMFHKQRMKVNWRTFLRKTRTLSHIAQYQHQPDRTRYVGELIHEVLQPYVSAN